MPTDDDGRPLPRSARKPTSRAWQWAVGLERIAAAFLGGRGAADDESPVDPELDPDGDAGGSRGTGRARPTVVVVAPLAELIGVDLEADSVTARLLLRRGSGRRRITRALARALADDADVVALFTDDDGMPVAIGDSHSPITPAMRRAVIARDQGCRAPGCSVPAEHCDVHHIIPREQGGATAVHNLALHCRHDNLAAHRHRWRQTLLPDGTLRTTIGRRTYVTRPRLRPPPTGGDPRGDRGGPGPDPPMPGRPDPAGAASTSTLPF